MNEQIQLLERNIWDNLSEHYFQEITQPTAEQAIRQDFCLSKAVELLHDVRGKRILDCGCGAANVGIYLALRGASVQAFDISEGMLKAASENINISQTNDKVGLTLSAFEALPFQSNCFDLAIGNWILHHVDIQGATGELHRVLKEGAKAVFVETWGKNPILMFARKHLTGRFGIAKYGTPTEHPLTDKDMTKIRGKFQVNLYFPEFTFFKKAGTNVFRWYKRVKFITDLLVKMDDFIFEKLPRLRKYSYTCMVVLHKDTK